ncbi:hypothetical protein H2201_001968 [Coniosporium apollinis]|uniref:Carboxylic ester hydrolase n=1 Tax=Coniosporium apollinis TaxID=61459 RepID=A0ABQ9P057_9PEZI|nr:hypothetical protein H2201_001968 [Coniosporium apollinis]
MKPTSLLLCLCTSLATASPFVPRQDRGSYIVPGFGSRKQAVISTGGTSLDLAVAMLETDGMTTDYAYGDNKSGDSANFGIFKQNWGMLRECASRFRGQANYDYNNGNALNWDLNADVTARRECQDYYGYDKWFAGHRNGASGLNNPNTQDIANYKTAVQWIQSQIDSDSRFRTDDTRFWVDVPAI